MKGKNIGAERQQNKSYSTIATPQLCTQVLKATVGQFGNVPFASQNTGQLPQYKIPFHAVAGDEKTRILILIFHNLTSKLIKSVFN